MGGPHIPSPGRGLRRAPMPRLLFASNAKSKIVWAAPCIWTWVKMKPPGIRRFQSMFPFTDRATHVGYLLLTHSPRTHRMETCYLGILHTYVGWCFKCARSTSVLLQCNVDIWSLAKLHKPLELYCKSACDQSKNLGSKGVAVFLKFPKARHALPKRGVQPFLIYLTRSKVDPTLMNHNFIKWGVGAPPTVMILHISPRIGLPPYE